MRSERLVALETLSGAFLPRAFGSYMQLLLVNPPEHALPEGIFDMVSEAGWAVASASNYRAAMEATCNDSIDAVILPEPGVVPAEGELDGDFKNLIRLIDAKRIAAVMVTEQTAARSSNPGSLIDQVSRENLLGELRGRLAMIERYHGLVQRMEHELHNMHGLGKRLNQHFQEVDQEMRLAGRLQRDFLPNLSEPIGNVRFVSLYRPVSWVSGDIFDVFRVDEGLTGFYVADAVGHGMSASLLTMFIKRAIVAKRVEDDGYTVLSPSETLSALNDAITDQSLPNCQFITAWYGLLDHRTMTLRYARGGHPYPFLITADGMISELMSSGGLLGIFKGEEFPTSEISLNPGDKLLLYTDGVDTAFGDPTGKSSHAEPFRRVLQEVAAQPVQTMLKQIESRLDGSGSPFEPRDDVTILGLEVGTPSDDQ